MKKKFMVAVAILCLATGCGKVPKLANGEDAFVTFDNTELNISASDMFNALKDKYALNVLIDMIDKTILLKEYPGLEEDAKKDVKTQLEEIKEYYVDDKGKYDEASLIEALNSYYGISTIEAFEEMLNLSFYRTKAIEDYAKSLVKEKDIKAYYKSDIVGDISAKHILITPDVTDKMTDDEKAAAEEAALKKAKNIIKELDAGKSFDELAKEHSADEGSASKGGDVGEFNKGKMVASFETAAYALKLNTYTKTPVKSEFGYHIILKTGEKEKQSLEEAKDSIIEKLAIELQSKDNTLAVNAMIELRKTYGVKVEDSEVSSKFSTYVSNQLISLQNAANAQQ